MTRRSACRVALSTVLVTLGMSLTAPTAHAAAVPSYSCDTGVGTRIPILLIHGFNSSAATWSDANGHHTKEYLGSNRRTCVATVDYGAASTRWVTDPDIAQVVATKILALANASARGGGPGKVIIVAHSMGGLAVRCAARQTCSGVHDVADHILTMITFGTPSTGTFWKSDSKSWLSDILLGPGVDRACPAGSGGIPVVASVCDFLHALFTSPASAAFTPGSKQLRQLPALPGSIPVRALAGSVEVTTSLFGHLVHRIGDGGDLVVDETSALAGAQGTLGGPKVVACGSVDIADFGAGALAAIPLTHISCWHSSETNDATFLALASAQINRFVPAGTSATMITNLMPVDQRHHVVAGWTTRSDAGPPELDCSFSSPAPSAVAPDIYDCSPTAAVADACWPAAIAFTMLCLRDPWSYELAQLQATTTVQPVHLTAATADCPETAI